MSATCRAEARRSPYGTLGAAAAVLLALFLICRVVVAAAALNATLFERRHRSDTARASPA